uniref:DUF1084 domain-containing protein n=1 Tax=Angiostrongylus cantonensis TaxID=6313 RepID=A0A0K0D8Q7_ANGCA
MVTRSTASDPHGGRGCWIANGVGVWDLLTNEDLNCQSSSPVHHADRLRIRFVSVLGYIFFILLPAISLSVYYVCL